MTSKKKGLDFKIEPRSKLTFRLGLLTALPVVISGLHRCRRLEELKGSKYDSLLSGGFYLFCPSPSEQEEHAEKRAMWWELPNLYSSLIYISDFQRC